MKSVLALGLLAFCIVSIFCISGIGDDCEVPDINKPSALTAEVDKENYTFKAVSDSDSVNAKGGFDKHSYLSLIKNSHAEKVLTANWEQGGIAGNIGPKKCSKCAYDSAHKSKEISSTVEYGHREPMKLIAKLLVPESDAANNDRVGAENAIVTRFVGEFESSISADKLVKVDIEVRSYCDKERVLTVECVSKGAAVAVDLSGLNELYEDMLVSIAQDRKQPKGVIRIPNEKHSLKVYRPTSLLKSFSNPSASVASPSTTNGILLPIGGKATTVMEADPDRDRHPHYVAIVRNCPIAVYPVDESNRPASNGKYATNLAICAFNAKVLVWKRNEQ